MHYLQWYGVDESLLWYQPVKTGHAVLLMAAIGGTVPMLPVGPGAEENIILM